MHRLTGSRWRSGSHGESEWAPSGKPVGLSPAAYSWSPASGLPYRGLVDQREGKEASLGPAMHLRECGDCDLRSALEGRPSCGQ